jgi:hypothetical protein
LAITLTTQNQFRAVQRRSFCYLCAETFRDGDNINRDHVPPSRLFAQADREPSLWLPTHGQCNSNRSADDEVITQLIGNLHGRPIAERGRQPRFAAGTFPDGTLGVGAALQLRPIIFRWVCGFHAALYDEPLGPAESFIFPPVPEGRVGENQIDPLPIPDVAPHLVTELKRNRLTVTIDSIICRNGRCHYECVWTQADDGRRICVWALNIYDWRELGDTTHFEPRGCVGVYRLKNGTVPRNAAIATRLHFSVAGGDRLDPFAG